MGYQNPNGCCCETCSQQLFVDGVETLLSRFTFTGDDTNWSIETSPYRLELNDGSGATPAASARKRITQGQRGGAQNFSIKSRFWSIFHDATFHSNQSGIFIANAFALWIDWTDNTLRYAPTDAVGTIDTVSNTLVKTYLSFPLNQSAQVKLYWNGNGKWNVEIWAPQDDGTQDPATLILWDQEFTGISSTGSFEFGLTATDGGGGWYDVITECLAASCGTCPDGNPLEWTKANTTIPDVASDPTSLSFWGSCAATANGALSPSVTQVQVGVTGGGSPDMRDLHASTLTWWLFLSIAGDWIYLIAEVVYDVGGLGGTATIGVSIWRIRKDAWCCYGSNDLTLVTSPGDPTFGGFNYAPGSGATRLVWLQSLFTEPTTITVAAVGPAPDTPCTADCLWTATVSGDTLIWVKDGSVCPSGLECVEPDFTPTAEGQQAYTTCE